MADLINVGFGNMISADKLIAIVSPDAAPVKRLITGAREDGKCIDASQGRKTKAVLVMETGHIVLSALVPETLSKRFSQSGITEEMDQ